MPLLSRGESQLPSSRGPNGSGDDLRRATPDLGDCSKHGFALSFPLSPREYHAEQRYRI